MPSFSPAISITVHTVRIQKLANELFACYGLAGWSFAFNRRKTEMGLCLYATRAIELSLHFVQMNPEEIIRDTLLHEIAHALVGPGHGHDEVWKQKCLEVGARPERLCFQVNMPEGRWQARCGCCGMLHCRHRKPKHMVGWFCRHCGQELGKLHWQHAGEGAEAVA
jgi:predicted SprT family Zn-dependent metalloprotease